VKYTVDYQITYIIIQYTAFPATILNSCRVFYMGTRLRMYIILLILHTWNDLWCEKKIEKIVTLIKDAFQRLQHATQYIVKYIKIY